MSCSTLGPVSPNARRYSCPSSSTAAASMGEAAAPLSTTVAMSPSRGRASVWQPLHARLLGGGSTWITPRRLRAGATVIVIPASSPARCSRQGGEASSPPRRRARSGAGARGQLEQALAEQPHLGHAALAGDLEELQAPLAEVEHVARVASCARLDAREDLVDAPVVPVGGDEQATEGVVGAPVVVPVQVRRETTAHLGEVVEAVGVEELLVEVGVEDLDLAVPLLVLGLDLVLLEVLEDRYAVRATVISSQLPPERWHDYLADPTVADAICDRVLHGAHRIALKGPSRRKDKEGKNT